MMQPTDLTSTALRELEVIATIAGDLDAADYDGRSNLPNWTVEDLMRHIVNVAFGHAEALHRARLTVAEAPAVAAVTAPREQLASALRSVLAHSTDGSSALDRTNDPIVPLPYASLPASLAGFVLLVEYGTHRYDMEQTVTGAGTLAADVADVIADRLDLVLTTLASTQDPPVTSIRLEPDNHPAQTLVWQSGTWGSGPSDATPDCLVRGPAEAIVLFVTGRIPATDERLATDDPAGALAQFKTLFPGP